MAVVSVLPFLCPFCALSCACVYFCSPQRNETEKWEGPSEVTSVKSKLVQGEFVMFPPCLKAGPLSPKGPESCRYKEFKVETQPWGELA